jgi:alpha-glucosidase (family GH31 glycosyl hydrolase)
MKNSIATWILRGCLGYTSLFLNPEWGLSQTSSHTQQIPILPGEQWWGGPTAEGEKMPFADQFSCDLAKSNYDNQSQPLLISSKGRYIWSELPFKFSIQKGSLVLESAVSLSVQEGGKNLSGAFKLAAASHFPSSGKMPDASFFSKPQWNTWIELGYNQNQKSILNYARTIVNEGFPAGIIMLDDTWQEDYGVWHFHNERFPDPKAMIDELHQLGFKVMVWIIPVVSPDSYHYRELHQQNALLIEKPHAQSDHYVWWADRRNQPAVVRWWNGISAVLDLTKPAAMNSLKKDLDDLRTNFGVDGFKFDGGDWWFYPGFTTSTAHAVEHARKYCELGLNYPLNEYRAAWKMGGQPLVQRLQDKNHTWSDLQELVPHMLAQGLTGYAFGCPDMIGGGMLGSFEKEKFDQDLFVRSAQIHALMPMMQFSMAPWRVLDPAHLQAVKSAVKIRQQQFEPLISRLSRDAAKTGEPIVRNMEYVFPGQNLSEVRNQFMLGDSVLVAPLAAKGFTREVLLPAGKWKADDGQVFSGPSKISVNVPLERIPYFIRQPETPAKDASRKRKSSKK